MVDAIGAGKPVKNIEALNINWNKLTAGEILEHEKQGEEIPKEILRWAEEMVKISGAIDNVTYEMAKTNPSTYAKENKDKKVGAANSEAIQATKVEYDQLVKKMNSSEPLTTNEQQRLVILGQELGKIGTKNENNSPDMSDQIENLNTVVNESLTNAQNVGANVAGIITPEQDLPDAGDIEKAKNNKDLNEKSDNAANSGNFDLLLNQKAKNDGIISISEEENKSKIETKKTEIKDTAIEKAKSDDNSKPKKTSEKEKPADKTTKKEEQEAITLADSNLTADNNKIIKRKERKGII